MYDLNVAWPGIQNSIPLLNFALSKGWNTIGFNVYFKADDKGVHPLDLKFEGLTSDIPVQRRETFTKHSNVLLCPESDNGTSHKGRMVTSDKASSPQNTNGDNLHQDWPIYSLIRSPGVPMIELNSSTSVSRFLGVHFIRRATIILLDGFKPNSLIKYSESTDYDIVSVMPTCQRSFNSACESINCDLINLNFYCLYNPFKIRRGMVTIALERGCYFEISLVNEDLYKKLNIMDNIEHMNIDDHLGFQSRIPSILRYIPLKN